MSPIKLCFQRQRPWQRQRQRLRQRGVALAIALILLLIATLLATGGMMTATAELVMAGNEQFHRHAVDAASAGVEVALARVATAAGGVFDNAGATNSGPYITSSRYAGEETSLPGFSAEKFAALHFEIESTGSSARNAQDHQLQGVMVIVSRDATQTFTRLGDGLGDAT
jgi:Tfp pilus assembly protein PilX